MSYPTLQGQKYALGAALDLIQLVPVPMWVGYATGHKLLPSYNPTLTGYETSYHVYIFYGVHTN